MVAATIAVVRPVASTAIFGMLIFFRLTVLINPPTDPCVTTEILVVFVFALALEPQAAAIHPPFIPVSAVLRIFRVPAITRCTPVGREPACLNSENPPSPLLYRDDTPCSPCATEGALPGRGAPVLPTESGARRIPTYSPPVWSTQRGRRECQKTAE